MINKIDLSSVSSQLSQLERSLLDHMSHNRILSISAINRIGLDEMKERTWKFLKKLKSDNNFNENENKNELAELQTCDVTVV